MKSRKVNYKDFVNRTKRVLVSKISKPIIFVSTFLAVIVFFLFIVFGKTVFTKKKLFKFNQS